MSALTTDKSPSAQRALVWSFANTASGKLGTLLISIIIARVLGPDEFGTYAVALVALAGLLSFNELGVSLAIVRWEGNPRQIAPTVTTISVLASALFFGFAFVCTPAFATAMGDPSATEVVRLMLVCVPLNGLVATPAALLQREYLQGRRTVADQVNMWLGAVTSVVLALLGFGAMSLAIGRVLAIAVFSIMLIFLSPLPLRFGWDRSLVRSLLKFGLPLAGASIVVFAVGYADQLIVGTLLGSQALGFYLLAFNLASWPVTIFSQPLRAVAPAAFSRIQDDARGMDLKFRAATRVVLAVSVPVCAYIAGVSIPLITFVYGDAWAPAALALQWLALQAAVRILFELSYDFLVVRRKSARLMAIQMVWLILLIPALVLGAHLGGIWAVALTQFIVALIVLLIGYSWALRDAGVALPRLVAASGVPLLGGLATGGLSFLFSRLIAADLVAVFAGGIVSMVVIMLLLVASRQSLRLLRGVDGSVSLTSKRGDLGRRSC